MVDGAPALLVLVPLEHREVRHPEERERRRRRPGRARARGGAAGARAPARSSAHVVGGEEQRLAGLPARAPRARCSERNFAIGERTSPLLVADEVREPLRAPLLRELLERRELGARERPRHAQEPHGLGAGEDAELRAARRLGRVLELEPEARVRLVGAEAPVGLGEGHPRPRRRDLDAEALAPDRARTSPPSARRAPRWSGKLISTSSWVISCTRSARRSSSRKQIAIW